MRTIYTEGNVEHIIFNVPPINANFKTFSIYLFIHLFIFAGIAFPTCISVNNCVCHYSPLKSEADVTLKNGDLVKM